MARGVPLEVAWSVTADMETLLMRCVRADPQVVFSLAAAVEEWPEILPHYRSVRVLSDRGSERTVEMAARRDRIPVWWTAEQAISVVESRITYRHIRGATRGMRVEWTFASDHDGLVRVRIWHGFWPKWPLIPDMLVQLIVGRLFVDHIARMTLAGIAAVAEKSEALSR